MESCKKQRRGCETTTRFAYPFKLSGSDFKDEAKAPANSVNEVVVEGNTPKPK